MSRDSWERVSALIAEWYRLLTRKDGVSQEELDTAEKRIGKPLPETIREWYALAGRCKAITDGQNHIVPIESLEVNSYWDVLDDAEQAAADEDDYLSGVKVYYEHGYIYHWKVLETDLDLPDPPVYIEDVEKLFHRETLTFAHTQFSEFVMLMTAFELTRNLPCRVNVSPKEETAIALADRHFTRLSDVPVCISVRFWEGEDVLVRSLYGDSLDLCARTPDALERVQQIMGSGIR